MRQLKKQTTKREIVMNRKRTKIDFEAFAREAGIKGGCGRTGGELAATALIAAAAATAAFLGAVIAWAIALFTEAAA